MLVQSVGRSVHQWLRSIHVIFVVGDDFYSFPEKTSQICGLRGMRWHEQVYTELEAVLSKVIRVAVERLSVQDLISSAVSERNEREEGHTPDDEGSGGPDVLALAEGVPWYGRERQGGRRARAAGDKPGRERHGLTRRAIGR